MIAPLYLFIFAGLFSPGPNVILLTASGARFGFLRTVPHILGVALGVGITSGVTGLGLGLIIQNNPNLRLALTIVAFLWIMWMAWKLLNAQPATADTSDRPFTLIEAVLFQWVNPKVWAVAVAATAYVATLPPTEQALRLAIGFAGINLFVCAFWTGFGHLLGRLMTSPRAWMIFRTIMAGLLAASALLLLVPR